MLEARLNEKLDRIHERLKWIADTEERAVWVNGFGANGELDDLREKLIAATDAALDALEKIGDSPKYHPK